MSQANDLASSLFATAQGFLTGSDSNRLSIGGGDLLSVVVAEDRTDRELDFGGQQVEIELVVVAKTSDWDDLYPSNSKEYLGKTSVLDTDTSYQVGRIERGANFTTIILVGVNQGA